MYFDTAGAAPKIGRQPISWWCVAPMWLALVPLVVFGLWWPSAMWDHFAAVAPRLWQVAAP